MGLESLFLAGAHRVYHAADFAGKNYDSISARMEQSIPGVPSFTDNIDLRFSLTRKSNLRFLSRALADALKGANLTSMQKRMLADNDDWIKIPRDLKETAFAYFQQVHLFGRRQEAIEQFPYFFEVTSVPLYKERLAALDITPHYIQQKLRENPDIDPTEAIFFFNCVLAPLETYDGKLWSFKQIIKDVARFIVAPRLGTDRDAIEYLLGFDESSLSKQKMMAPLGAPTGFNTFISYAYSLPIGMNEELDQRRYEAWQRYVQSSTELPPDLPPRGAVDFKRHIASARWFLRNYYPDQPAVFIRSGERAKAERDKLKWADVDTDLRAAFEAAGFADERQIAAAINADPIQRDIANDIDVILLRGKGQSGYVVTGYEVLQALLHPEQARFAKGLAINPLHERLHKLAATNEDFDTSYGVTAGTPKTPEQHATVVLLERIRNAATHHKVAGALVTNEQWAHFLGIRPEDWINLLTHPYNAYFAHNNGPPRPEAAIVALQKELGISFFDDWIALHEARQKELAEAQRQTKAQIVTHKPVQAVPPAPVDPWLGIAINIADLVREKFATPEMLAEAVRQNLVAAAALPERVNERMKALIVKGTADFLRHPNAALTSEGMPHEIIPGRVLEALGEDARATGRALSKTGKAAVGGDALRQEMQANIVAALMRNQNLAHILDWRLLKQTFSAASVVRLGDELHVAYRRRSPRDAALILIPSDALAGIVSALNTGLEPERHYHADQVVPVDLWIRAARARTGRDPLPGEKNRSIYELVLK
jgi:hypothetical protein